EVCSEVRHVLGLGEFVHLGFVHRSVLSSISVQIRSRSWAPSMEEFMEEKSRKERYLVKRSGAPKSSTHHYLPAETLLFESECERPLRGQNHSHSIVGKLVIGLAIPHIVIRLEERASQGASLPRLCPVEVGKVLNLCDDLRHVVTSPSSNDL
ncbi:MAG: hypothetical protein Q4B54_03625, partial [Coriobacteriales bacterium]|nr:hypothetical protein [Coriobacteriales bacterium]